MVKNCQLGPILSYGSEGTVHSGSWQGTIAAIKVLTNQYARRAETEMKLVRSLNQINIIKYYDLEYEKGIAYLSMEFITGGNLYEFIQKQVNSSSYWTIIDQILQDVARGMAYLHNSRIVQGDLKSHNILLRENTYQAVICDFGIAKYLDNDHQEKKRTNTTKGTIRWMAPELCTPPPEPSSYLSDVWSYGCTILEVTSAHEPWTEQYNDDSLLFRALQRKENAYLFARICTNQTGPLHLRQLLIQCCAWSKTDRPQFTDILRQFNVDEYADCMSVDSTVSNEQSSTLERNDDCHTKIQYQTKQNRNMAQTSTNSHGGRLTGEVYTSKGTANGRPIYEGAKGGLYYLTPSGAKVYLHK
ncbi:hypothetical protein I4U23_003969 [Adineta vaga]|nr:hypothetical protein I4U23_003969 [Adineta vaga]